MGAPYLYLCPTSLLLGVLGKDDACDRWHGELTISTIYTAHAVRHDGAAIANPCIYACGDVELNLLARAVHKHYDTLSLVVALEVVEEEAHSAAILILDEA